MSAFQKIDEKEFLIGYLKFTLKLRCKILEILDEKTRKATIMDEKQYYYIAGLEQLFMLYETFEGYYIAFRDRRKHPFLDSLNKDINTQNLTESLINKSEDKIIEELDYKLDGLTEEQTRLVQIRLIGISRMWKDKKVAEVMRKMFIPMFNAIKHKLRLYKKDNKIYFVFDDRTEEQLSKLIKEYDLSQEIDVSSLEGILKIAKTFQNAIQDLISLRLFELGMRPTELVALIS